MQKKKKKPRKKKVKKKRVKKFVKRKTKKILRRKRKKRIDKTDTPTELIIKTKPEWVRASLANKSQYQKIIKNL